MTRWYIDALDARAGIGFASYRTPDLHHDNANLGLPSVFISPPYFRGESVASRAIGFAATRASFQYGLFVEDREVGFDSIQGLAEFIRRAYVSSGGGDVDNGGTPMVPIPNPENSSGGELFAFNKNHEDVPIIQEFISIAEYLRDKVQKLPEQDWGVTENRSYAMFRANDSYIFPKDINSLHSNAAELVAYGAALLIHEMLLRFPDDPDRFAGWMKSSMKLGRIVVDLGLVNSLMLGHWAGILHSLADRIEQHFGALHYHRRHPVDPLLALLGIGPVYPEYWEYGPWQLGTPIQPSCISGDPMDDLSSLALSEVTAKHLKLNRRTASAKDLLCAFFANPTVIIEQNMDGYSMQSTEIVAIALFSCMRVVSVGRPSFLTIDGTPMGKALMQELTREAIIWMETQMPNYVFSTKLEAMIKTASRLRYADAQHRAVSPIEKILSNIYAGIPSKPASHQSRTVSNDISPVSENVIDTSSDCLNTESQQNDEEGGTAECAT